MTTCPRHANKPLVVTLPWRWRYRLLSRSPKDEKIQPSRAVECERPPREDPTQRGGMFPSNWRIGRSRCIAALLHIPVRCASSPNKAPIVASRDQHQRLMNVMSGQRAEYCMDSSEVGIGPVESNHSTLCPKFIVLCEQEVTARHIMQLHLHERVLTELKCQLATITRLPRPLKSLFCICCTY